MTTIAIDAEKLAEIKSRIRTNDGIAQQPIGSHGFRRGCWTVLVDGVKRKFYCSVPHGSELSDQYDMVRDSVAMEIYREEAR